MLALLSPTLSSELNTAWQVIYNALEHAQGQWKTSQGEDQDEIHSDDGFKVFVDYGEDDTESLEGVDDDPVLPTPCHMIEDGDHLDHVSYSGASKVLGTLWASIQAEFLTYRRLKVGDPWISKNFIMSAVLDGLHNESHIAMPLSDKGMMKPFCACGMFLDCPSVCATTEYAATYYFPIMEDYKRMSFLPVPEYW